MIVPGEVIGEQGIEEEVCEAMDLLTKDEKLGSKVEGEVRGTLEVEDPDTWGSTWKC